MALGASSGLPVGSELARDSDHPVHPDHLALAPAAMRPRHPLALASRIVAALLGGYALATAFTVALGRSLSLPGDDAFHTAALPAFLLYLGAAIWAFYAATATRAWLGVAAPTAVFAVLAWWLRAPSVT